MIWVKTVMDKFLVEGDEIRVITYQDVTEFTQAETKLRSEIAKQEQLFAIIGHELRTPASALKMLLEDQGVAQLEPHGGVIDETVTHLLNVLDDMRIITRPELVLESPEVRGSVPQMVRSALPLVGRLLVESGLSVQVEASAISETHCIVREQLVRQIVLNLVKNCALHAHATHLLITVDAQARGDSLLFTLCFADNGKGVRKEDQASLFEAFKRGETSADGTGLGLHISQTYARNVLNGDLQYEDNSPSGARFTLTAEFKRTSLELENRERERQAIDASNVLDRLTILFAEDSPVLRMMTVKVLEKQGAIVLAAEDGREALERAKSEPFDLVLTDIFMPNIDGYALTHELRQTLGFKGPIFGISAAVVGQEADHLISEGANLVLPKPLDLWALKETLAQHAYLIEQRAAHRQGNAKPTVLVIDDDPLTLGMFTSLLEDDYEVYTEVDALKSVATYKALKPELVLCDVSMPGVNGLEVLKQIHSLDPSTPIIQMSGTGTASHYLKIAKTMGATEVLDKTSDQADILALISRALNRT